MLKYLNMKIILRVIFYIIKAIKFCKNLKIIIVSIQKFIICMYITSCLICTA